MSRDMYEIKAGAVLIADAHYSDIHPEFLDFLKAVESGVIVTPQLILMGDIFDLLFGYIPLTQQRNREAIALINTLCKRMEILYLEGNHDFQLQTIFPHIRVVPVEQQPLLCHYNNKKILLSHGDYRGTWSYRLYLFLIRSSPVLRLLNIIDRLTNNGIIKRLDSHLSRKNHCRTIPRFQEKIDACKELFEQDACDCIIEGHFHQNRTFHYETFHYINLAAFACNQRYFIVQCENKQELLQEVIFK